MDYSYRRSRAGSNRRFWGAVAALTGVFLVVGLVAAVTLAPSVRGAGVSPVKRPRVASTAPAAAPVATPAVEPTAPAVVASETTTPPVPAGGDALAAYAVAFPGAPEVEPRQIRRLHPNEKMVAITLDDGPISTRMVELLERYDAKCTTFVLGRVAASQPKMLERLKADGFEIANHTWSHPILTRKSAGEIESQLTRTQKAITKVTGNQAPYMRPPGGAVNDQVKRIAGSLGYTVVLWNKSFADTSRSATPEQEYKNVMRDLAPGDIILCHWGGRHSYEAMQLILPELKARGYRVVTISEMVRASGGLDASAKASSGSAGATPTGY